MGFTNAQQLQELFLASGMGFLLGMLYAVCHALRRWIRPPRFVSFCWDCVFFAMAAVLVFLFSLAMTDGIVRSYVIIGVAIGALVYRYTVGAVLSRIGRTAFRKCATLCRQIRAWIFAPVRRAFRVASGLVGKIWEKPKKLWKKSELFLKKGLQPVRRIMYNHRV